MSFQSNKKGIVPISFEIVNLKESLTGLDGILRNFLRDSKHPAFMPDALMGKFKGLWFVFWN